MFTQSTLEHTDLTTCASGDSECVCVCIQNMHVHVFTVYDHKRLPRNSFWHFCVCTSFNVDVTVDTALLRRRLAVLLWADIRASMSSSTSSSENSCGWQHSDLIKRESASGKLARVSMYFAQFSYTAALCGWMQPASINSIRQVRTERGNLVTRLLHAKSLIVIGFAVNLWAWMNEYFYVWNRLCDWVWPCACVSVKCFECKWTLSKHRDRAAPYWPPHLPPVFSLQPFRCLSCSLKWALKWN